MLELLVLGSSDTYSEHYFKTIRYCILTILSTRGSQGNVSILNHSTKLFRIYFLTATPPGTTKHDEREQERPVTEVHEDEAVTSVVAMDVHENEATPLVTISGGAERTDDLVMRGDTSTTEPTVTDEDSADALDSEPLASTLTNHSVDIQGKITLFVLF